MNTFDMAFNEEVVEEFMRGCNEGILTLVENSISNWNSIYSSNTETKSYQSHGLVDGVDEILLNIESEEDDVCDWMEETESDEMDEDETEPDEIEQDDTKEEISEAIQKGFEMACFNDRLEIVKYLIGVNNDENLSIRPELIIYDGIIEACLNGALNVFDYLLPIVGYINAEMFHSACHGGNYEIVISLFTEALTGDDIKNGFIRACGSDNIILMEFLLGAINDDHELYCEGLMEAFEFGANRAIHYLIGKGANNFESIIMTGIKRGYEIKKFKFLLDGFPLASPSGATIGRQLIEKIYNYINAPLNQRKYKNYNAYFLNALEIR